MDTFPPYARTSNCIFKHSLNEKRPNINRTKMTEWHNKRYIFRDFLTCFLNVGMHNMYIYFSKQCAHECPNICGPSMTKYLFIPITDPQIGQSCYSWFFRENSWHWRRNLSCLVQKIFTRHKYLTVSVDWSRYLSTNTVGPQLANPN